MDELIFKAVEALGAEATVAVAVITGLSFVASVLNAIWSDDNMPPLVRKVVTILSGSVGKGANDPNAQ